MSCPSERTWSVYVDGELPSDELRTVETHLIQCQRCRGRILALQDEAALITQVLHQREPEARGPVAPRARAQGLAIGIGPTLGVGLLVVTTLGWLVEQRLPGFSWLDPRNLMGAYEMVFDTVFTLRDTLPALFDLGVAVGATAGMAAVLTFVGTTLLRRFVGTAATLLLASVPLAASLLAAPRAEALDLRWDVRTVEVERGEVLEDTLIASAGTFDISGTVRGDVVALAERVTIRGVVEGNVFAAAREVLVTGTIDGSLHMLCERCSLEGTVTGNLYSGAEHVTIGEDGHVERDAQLFGAGIRVEGSTGRDLSAAGEWVELRGSVGRTARTTSRRVTVSDEVEIGRDLLIRVPEDGEAEVGAGVSIGGELSQTVLEHSVHERGSRWLDGGFYLRTFVFLVSAFLVGLALHALFPGLFSGSLETAGEYLRCLGTGFVVLVAVPIALILCAITVVGIPIAILGLFGYLTLLFVSTIVVAALVGSSILGSGPESPHGFGPALLLGLVLVVAAMNLPFIGGLLRLLVVIEGMGLVAATAWESWQARQRSYA